MPTPARAQDAIEVARCLAGPWNAGAVTRIADIADPHLPKPLERAGPTGMAALGGLPPAAGREQLARLIEPALVDALLPALRDAMVARLDNPAAVPDGTPDLPECADAFQLLRDWACRRQRHPEVPVLAIDVGRAILLRAKASTESIAVLVDRGDVPDLPALSLDLMRLEGLRWVAEVMRDGPAQQAIGELSRRLARLALTRAAATIEAFVGKRDLMALFDNVLVISQVDDLIVLAQRLLDAHEAGEEESTPFVPTGDEKALAEFTVALTRLADALFALARAAATKPGHAPTFFSSVVRQTDCLFRFATQLHHGAKPPALAAVEERLRGHLRTLAREFAAVLSATTDQGDPATRRAALAQAREFGTMLERHGLVAESGLIAVRIHAATKRP